MSGKRIDLAKQALKLFLHSLPIGAKFNIVSFGSDFSLLFPESREYSDESLEEANVLLNKMGADMGGTEIYQPLDEIFK